MIKAVPRTLNSEDNLYRRDRIGKLQVMIIISSTKASQLVRDIFHQLGFQHVTVAENAIRGMQLMRDMSINLLVTDSDISLGKPDPLDAPIQPGDYTLSGIEFVHRVRHAPYSPNPYIPVLLLMDMASAEEIKRARDAGINDVIINPLQAKNFCDRIIALIDQPRPFVTSPAFKGPCRRRHPGQPPGQQERRVHDVKLIRVQEAIRNRL